MAVKVKEQLLKAEEAEVTNRVSDLIHAFTNGLNVFKKLRERRRKRKARKENKVVDATISAELELSKSLRRGPQELAERYDECYSQTGLQFAKGDAIAHASLAEILIKLNTGLVAIIASFLNNDQKGSKGSMHLDYKSLTNLSDTSRKEALQSMTCLYQRLTQSQLQIHNMKSSCPKCGSSKHMDCSSKSSAASSLDSSEKKKRSTSRQRVNGPTITRIPTKTSRHPQLVMMRPKTSSRKNSSSSHSSSTKSNSTSGSTYTSPSVSPLPIYIAEAPLEIETNGVVKGVLGGPPPPLYGYGRRRADSYDVYDPRPETWPHHYLNHPAFASDHLNYPVPKLPVFAPTPRKPNSPSRQKKSSSNNTSPRRKASIESPPQPAYPPPAPPLSPSIVKRRSDKPTPSSYTFASDSTKLGEIPQRNWTVPWDYEEAERLNAQAALATAAAAVAANMSMEDARGRKKGLFRWMKKERE